MSSPSPATFLARELDKRARIDIEIAHFCILPSIVLTCVHLPPNAAAPSWHMFQTPHPAALPQPSVPSAPNEKQARRHGRTHNRPSKPVPSAPSQKHAPPHPRPWRLQVREAFCNGTRGHDRDTTTPPLHGYPAVLRSGTPTKYGVPTRCHGGPVAAYLCFSYGVATHCLQLTLTTKTQCRTHACRQQSS